MEKNTTTKYLHTIVLPDGHVMTWTHKSKIIYPIVGQRRKGEWQEGVWVCGNYTGNKVKAQKNLEIQSKRFDNCSIIESVGEAK